MASTQIATQTKSSTSFATLAKATGIAALVATIGNLLILALASLLLGVPFSGPMVNPISVIASTIVGAVLGAGVYAIVLRTSSQPQRTFSVLGIAGYLVSLLGPIMGFLGMMPGMSVNVQLLVAMILMHTWTATVIVRTLTGGVGASK